MSVEFVGIELELRGAEGVYRDLQNIDRVLNSLGGRKQVKSGLTDLKKDIVATRGEIEKLEREQKKWQDLQRRVGKDNMSAFGTREMERNAKALQETKMHLKDLQQAEREVQAATRNMGRTMTQEFNAVSSKIAHVGSAMQSLGNALTRLTSPFSRLTTGLLMGAGYKALNLFTEGISNSFGRADTMNKYTRLMKEYETANYTAEQSRIDLDKSIQGLPIALDEAISLAQRYTLSLGDMERGTQLAIATNNAFLASMATEQQRYQGMLQLQDLMNGKDLNSREWMSLGSSMGKAINEVGLKLGWSKDRLGEFRQELYAGNIATQDFLDALIEVGTGNGALVNLARASAETWEGLFSNIRIAVTRMGANVVDTLNETFKDATGRTLLQQLLGIDAEGNEVGDGIKHWIDGISKSVQDWIRANPDKILDFFNKLKAIDWKGLIKGIAEGLSTFLKVIDALAGLAGSVGLERVGKWLPRLNILGKALTVGGGILKGTRHIWAGAWIGGKLLGKGKLGIFGKLASVFGKKKDIDAAGDAAKSVPKVSDTFRSAFKSLEGLIKAAGALTLVAGTGAVVFASAKSILKNLKEMTDLVNSGGWDNVGYVGGGVILAIGTFTEIFNAIGAALGPTGLLNTAIASAASLLVTGTLWADTELIKDGLYNIRDTIKGFDEVASAINNMQGFTSLSDNAKTKISNTIDTIREVANLLVGKNGGPASRGEYSQGLPMFVGARANGVKNIANALKSMQDIIKNVNALSSMGINVQGNFKSKLEAVGDAIDEVYRAFPRLVRGTAGASNLNTSATNFANALIGIRRMAYHINKLAGTSVDTGGFASFVAQLKTALESLKDVQGDLELDIRVKIATGFQTSVNNVIKSINNAKKKITTAAGKGIRVTIPVSIRFSVTSNIGTALGMIAGWRNNLRNQGSGGGSRHTGVQEAMGGYVYRANGGGVPFRRRGTDTVPAMLTPGEYVHNKRAVSAFGIDFMRKVNNLDMKGAMNELMHRAGGMANINRGTSIVNNNYNNQKVTINNNGNTGAGFTFKSASRFVGAF